MSGPASPPDGRAADPQYGDTWVYESIVGALPGVDVSPRLAIGIQVGAFEAGGIVLWWYYDLPAIGLLAGTVAILVAAVGSVLMWRLGERVRSLPTPPSYRLLLFGSGVEVVLGVLAFSALLTYLFVVDPRRAGETLLTTVLGEDPPTVAVYLTMLVLWDLTYRIGTGWWACVTALYRSLVYPVTADAVGAYRRADVLTLAFGVAQAPLLPFVVDHPTLFVAVSGHILAVTVVSVASLAVLTVE